jgi:hypothetical protein
MGAFFVAVKVGFITTGWFSAGAGICCRAAITAITKLIKPAPKSPITIMIIFTLLVI